MKNDQIRDYIRASEAFNGWIGAFDMRPPHTYHDSLLALGKKFIQNKDQRRKFLKVTLQTTEEWESGNK